MASLFAHAAAALALSAAAAPRRASTAEQRPAPPRDIWRRPLPLVPLLAVVVALLPDVDVLGFALGIEYGDPWGHRGITHSLAFAALMAVIVTIAARRRALASGWSPARLVVLLLIAGASHGLLDMLTDGGLGVAIFGPFDATRYFFPVTPIRVSPIGVSSFFTARGAKVLASEALWVGLPSLALALAAHMSSRGSKATEGSTVRH